MQYCHHRNSNLIRPFFQPKATKMTDKQKAIFGLISSSRIRVDGGQWKLSITQRSNRRLQRTEVSGFVAAVTPSALKCLLRSAPTKQPDTHIRKPHLRTLRTESLKGRTKGGNSRCASESTFNRSLISSSTTEWFRTFGAVSDSERYQKCVLLGVPLPLENNETTHSY